MRESVVERALVGAIERRGGLCLKLIPSTRGLPDRLILTPGGGSATVEIKRPGAKPRESQLMVHRRLEAMGHHVHVVDSVESAERLAEEIFDEKRDVRGVD